MIKKFLAVILMVSLIGSGALFAQSKSLQGQNVKKLKRTTQVSDKKVKKTKTTPYKTIPLESAILNAQQLRRELDLNKQQYQRIIKINRQAQQQLVKTLQSDSPIQSIKNRQRQIQLMNDKQIMTVLNTNQRKQFLQKNRHMSHQINRKQKRQKLSVE